ncbi:hypothetical protein DV735_g1857, partial [Chaetothyriales sp. CBS 134920]
MSAHDQSLTASDMQCFTATGRPYQSRDKRDKRDATMLGLSTTEAIGHGTPALLPRRYTNDSLITVPVMRPEDVGTADGHKSEKKRSLFSSRRRAENSKFVMKQIPRGEYLKHYAKDDAGQYVGTEEPAADCILRGEDVAKYRGRLGALSQRHDVDIGSEVTLARAKADNVNSPQSRSQAASHSSHWRYISSYHGPWLNLPPEVLESLACSNFYSPRPQPIDPAVFFDLVKIRRLIDDATGLAVRAANGTTSAALSNSLNATNGILSGADVDILGLGSSRGGGGNAKLSRERKHRMREHATQKLAAAYRLDEIAASVVTMQSASALEDVAKLVLQRQETDADAQYVHFFHEKIPSRALAASTTLDVLTDIIHQRPTDPATYRTRAITRVFKDDHGGAARDLTDGLAVFKLYHTGHSNEQRDLILARDVARLSRDYSRQEARVDEKDQPSSLELQFLFHRGNTYLTLACGSISAALQGQHNQATKAAISPPAEKDPAQGHALAEARKMVRTCAKRALRDYLVFLSHLDYTPGLSAEHTDAFLQRLSAAQQSQDSRSRSRSEHLLNLDAHSRSGLAEALVKYEDTSTNGSEPQNALPPPHIPKPKVHKLNALFAAVPPADLPPYPADASDNSKPDSADNSSFNLADFSEAVTYHPLLTEVLHSILLCHCLIQTSAKEHRRHAYMAARVARVCDGYPIFLAARSPARADWMEILRRSNNFLDLEASWETLCQAPIRNPPAGDKKKKHGSNASVNGSPGSTSSATIPVLTTDRAEAIVRWIRDAPSPGASGSGSSSSCTRGTKKKKKTMTPPTPTTTSRAPSENASLEKSVESIALLD